MRKFAIHKNEAHLKDAIESLRTNTKVLSGCDDLTREAILYAGKHGYLGVRDGGKIVYNTGVFPASPDAVYVLAPEIEIDVIPDRYFPGHFWEKSYRMYDDIETGFRYCPVLFKSDMFICAMPNGKHANTLFLPNLWACQGYVFRGWMNSDYQGKISWIPTIAVQESRLVVANTTVWEINL
jgi:hypothetical protein